MIPRLHIITDDEILHREAFLHRAREVLEGGREGVALHLRGPGSPGGFLFHLASTLSPLARTSGATLLVNDRLDVALALDLAGVHLARRSLPISVARELLGPEQLVGVSVHGPEEYETYGRGADYLVVGTLFATPSHPDVAPAGTGVLKDLRNAVSQPILGIGGITPERVPEVMGAGAHGVAVRGGIWNAQDPAAAVGVFLNGVQARPNVEEGTKGETGGPRT